MSIDRKIKHYSLNNPASIYNEEALTSLELSARTAGLVNECVDNFNQLESNTVIHLDEQDKDIDTRMDAQDKAITNIREVVVPADVDKEMNARIADGTFDRKINLYAGELSERVDNLLGSVSEGSTTMDAEVIDLRLDGAGVVHNDAGSSVRAQVKNAKAVSVPLSINNLLNNALSVKEGYVYGGEGELPNDNYRYFTLKLAGGTYYSNVKPRFVVDVTNNLVYGDDASVSEIIEIPSEATVHITYKVTDEPMLYYYLTPWQEVEKLGEKKISEAVKTPHMLDLVSNLFTTNNLFNKAESFAGYMDRDNNFIQPLASYKTYKMWLDAGSYTIYPKARFIFNATDRTQIGSASAEASSAPITINVATRSLYYITMSSSVDAKLYDSTLNVDDVDSVGVYHLADNVHVVADETSTTDVLYGKKYVACGDSFTEGGTNGDITEGRYAGYIQAYPYFIGNRNNMEVVNMAVSGMTMCNIDGNTANAFSNEIYKSIPLDADYITLKFGINDHNFSSPLGTIDDTDNTTFYGAWNVVMEYIITNMPYAKVGIIVTNGTARTELTEATRAIARKWGVPVLDEAGDYNVPLLQRVHEKSEVCDTAIEARLQAFRVSEYDTHPNGKAHEYESTFVEAFMRRL